MKLSTIALAGALALSSTLAFAQTGTGATAPEKSDAASSPTGKPSGDAAMQKNMGTTGTSNRPSGADASTSGAPSGAPVNNKGTDTQPGAVRDGKNAR
jgi:hypothetical protein